LARCRAISASDDIHARVRERLRALRTERGLTLADVAAAAGMDASTLSRLESGARRLTLDHLPALARALGVRADDLLAAPDAEDPRVRPTPQRRAGMIAWRLNHRPETSPHHAFKIRLPVRKRPALRTHEGHEWLYVLSGRVRLVVGDRDLVLEPGEAAEFSTWIPHWIGAVGRPAEIIAIFGPQGERVHLRQETGDG
jgi:transcriptional regulator with XRE-family HTH domain